MSCKHFLVHLPLLAALVRRIRRRPAALVFCSIAALLAIARRVRVVLAGRGGDYRRTKKVERGFSGGPGKYAASYVAQNLTESKCVI